MNRVAFFIGAIAFSALIATAGSWLGPFIPGIGRPSVTTAAAADSTGAAYPVPLVTVGAEPVLAERIVPANTDDWVVVPDTSQSGTIGRFVYGGQRWSHVSGFLDGRLNGTSSRSDHVGDTATILFTGRRIAVYGVDGRAGGFAKISLDGVAVGEADFFSSTIRPKIVYMSPRLVAGPHKLAIAVSGDRPADSDGAFVNVNYAKIQP